MPNKTKKFIRGAGCFLELAAARIQRKQIPFVLYFLITERCNLRCPYCWIRRSPEVYAKELTTRQVLAALSDFRDLGTRYVSILGGEPLLREDLDEIITHTKKLGLMNDVITNGHLIPRQIEALKKVDLVCISLEGARESHDKDRGKGNYDEIIGNIELLKKNNIRFRFNTTVTQHTVGSFKHIAQLAKKFNSAIAVSIAIVSSGRESELVPDAGLIRDFWKEVRALRVAGYPIEKSLAALDALIEHPDFFLDSSMSETVPKGRGINPCAFGRYLVYLGSDGTLFPCCHPDLYGKKDFGANIITQGAHNAWENVVKNTHCRFCNMIFGCEINNFLNLDVRSLFETVHAYISHRG